MLEPKAEKTIIKSLAYRKDAQKLILKNHIKNLL